MDHETYETPYFKSDFTELAMSAAVPDHDESIKSTKNTLGTDTDPNSLRSYRDGDAQSDQGALTPKAVHTKTKGASMDETHQSKGEPTVPLLKLSCDGVCLEEEKTPSRLAPKAPKTGSSPCLTE